VDHPVLKTFDNILRSAVSDITNAELSVVQWLQACKPIKQGGLGVREGHSLARPAYLASAASTLDLQTSVLTACPCATDSHFESYLSFWQADGGILSTLDPLPPYQSFWDKPGIVFARDLVESSYSDPQQRARFLAAAFPHSGDWLLALPVTACGLRLSDEAVRVAVSVSWMQRMRTTFLSMRIIGGCPGTSWLGLQAGSEQNNQVSCTE